MSVPHQNRRQLPFTQLWYNFSKQWEKQNKAVYKANRINKYKNFDENTFKRMHQQVSRKKLSSGHAAKRNSDFCLSNISVENLSNMSKNLDKKAQKINQQHKHRNSVHQCNSMILCESKRKNSEYSEQLNMQISKSKTANKVLQIIETNVIPFMVDKFIGLEDKMQKQIIKMQGIIVQQNQKIKILHRQKNDLNQMVTEMKKTLEFHMQSKYIKQRPLKQKVYGQLHKNNNNLQNIQNSNLSLNNNQQLINKHQKNMHMFKGFFQKIKFELQQSKIQKIQVNKKIQIIERQMKKVSEKTELIEQKVQNQFADRILELIATYNDNFVDLDKRVSNIQDTIFQQKINVKPIQNNLPLQINH